MSELKYDILDNGTIVFPDTGHRYNVKAVAINPNGAHPDVIHREQEAVRRIALQQIPNSQSLKSQELGMRLVKVWGEKEPALRPYAVDGLVPTGATTTLFAPGGYKKSLLALFLATAHAVGRPFLNKATRLGNALFVDAELDEEEFMRRAYRVARGMSLDRPPAGLHYVRLRGSLMNPKIASQVLELKEQAKAELMIVDSMMAATVGGEMVGDATDATTAYQLFDALGTCVVIDHTPKPAAGSNHSDLTPYGTVFKTNWSRSVLQLVQADGGGQVLRQTKHNFGQLADPIAFAMTFADEQVEVEVIDQSDERLAGIENHLSAIDRVYHALAQYENGITAANLAEDIDRSESTVRNYLTALKKTERAETDGGVWKAIPNSQSLRDQELGTTACRVCHKRWESQHIDEDGVCFVCTDGDERAV